MRLCVTGSVLLALLLLLLKLLLLLFLLLLLLLLLLSLLGRLLLACFDVSLVLRGVFLLLLEALGLVGAFLSLLPTLGAGLIQLLLVIRLLFVVGSLVGRTLRLRLCAFTLRLIQRMLTLLVLERLLVRRALRRFRLALRLIERMLALLVLECLRTRRLVGGALRRIGLVTRALQRGLLVAAACVVGTLLFVERQLLLANVRLHHAHRVARLAKTVIHEKRVVAVVLRHAVLIVVFRRTPVKDLLARREIVLDRAILSVQRNARRSARSIERNQPTGSRARLRATCRRIDAGNHPRGCCLLRKGRNTRRGQQGDGTSRRAGGGLPCGAFARTGPDR